MSHSSFAEVGDVIVTHNNKEYTVKSHNDMKVWEFQEKIIDKIGKELSSNFRLNDQNYGVMSELNIKMGNKIIYKMHTFLCVFFTYL